MAKVKRVITIIPQNDKYYCLTIQVYDHKQEWIDVRITYKSSLCVTPKEVANFFMEYIQRFELPLIIEKCKAEDSFKISPRWGENMLLLVEDGQFAIFEDMDV